MEKCEKRNCGKCRENKAKNGHKLKNQEEVFVYTNLKGNTLTISSNDQTTEMIIMSDLMLKDILTIESGKSKESYLSGLDEMASGLYSNAFLHMIFILDNNTSLKPGIRAGKKDCIPQTVVSAIESLNKNERNLKETCKRLEEGGLYPGCNFYMNLMRSKYYIEIWNRQLQMLVAMFCRNRMGCTVPIA